MRSGQYWQPSAPKCKDFQCLKIYTAIGSKTLHFYPCKNPDKMAVSRKQALTEKRQKTAFYRQELTESQ